MYKLQIYDHTYGHPGRPITDEQYHNLPAKDRCLFARVVEDDYTDDLSSLEISSDIGVDGIFDDPYNGYEDYSDDDFDDYESDLA